MATGYEASKETDEIAAAPGSPLSLASESAKSSELDDNYHLYKRSEEEEIDAAEAKRVLRKLDLRLVPILFLIYLLQYLDKNGINYASVYGLQKGTNLHGQDYSWLGSIFYFGTLCLSFTRVTLTDIQAIWFFSYRPDTFSRDFELAR